MADPGKRMRLTHPDIRPATTPIRISFDGQALEALPGETIAATLSAAGILAYRTTPSGAPRGLHCGMGACFDCLVTVDGRPGQRACLTKVRDGMAVGSAPPAAPAPLAAAPEAIPERDCDVLVIGAGPAGLSAARAAAEAGARVVVLDERGEAGGQYLKPLAASHQHAAPDAQFRKGETLRALAQAAGAEILTGATVWGGFAPDEIGALIDGAAVTLRPRRLILAAGAHERPVPVPGWTLPGVMTTGGMQTLARANRVSPGRRIVIGGNGPLNLQLACELLDGGAEVVAVAEAAPRPGLAQWRDAARILRASPDLAWDGLRYLQRLRRAGIPVLWGSTILACEGEDRFTALRLRTPEGERRIEADACALNLGFQPETGLARALGAGHRFTGERLETVAAEDGRTSLASVFAVGDGAAIGGARIALARGRLAGLAAAADLGLPVPDAAPARAALRRALAFQSGLWRLFAAPPFDIAAVPDETILCRCEEVTAGRLRAEQSAGLRSLAALKKATRAGMGRCQGRMCSTSIARLCGVAEEAGFAAPRAPVKPVPVAALMLELGEGSDWPTVPLPHYNHWAARPAAPLAESCDVLVIGGGALGLSTAMYLAREGADVLLVERGEAGMAASTANAGSLHVQLLTYDFDGEQEAGPSLDRLPLGPRSIALWREIAAEAGEGLGIRTEGGLMLAETEAQFRWLRAKVAAERARGIESHVLGANELMSLAPYLGPHFIGAGFAPGEGQIDPLRGTLSLRRLAARAGARLREGVEVQAIAREGSGFAVTTAGGTIRAGRVVNCAGAHAGRIAAMLGVTLPVVGSVQQVIATEGVAPVMRHLVAHAGRHLSLKQGDGGHVLVGGGWPGVLDARGAPRNLRRSIEGNLWVAGRVLPGLAGMQAIRAWTGLAVEVDRAPLLGEVPGIPGLFHAVTSNGYTLAPIAGRMTADAVLGRGKVPPEFTLARFG
ncbi:MAG: SoxB-like sarcosine oxidase, subunit beta related [uncultured Craurococcus sp.]|uniref:SoxB-like sarcosine oxidase, subunit beta related n=1 Tax=uncultured Craurococcus sp. TaxID=1135998 RepID=A0A6J4JI23_9PROT|nr:MAG: SoxB-like sarcosine oxidase, subunit beta related [uncultured Craurococcus sp.]